MQDFIDPSLTDRAKRMLAGMGMLMQGDSAGAGAGLGTNPPESSPPSSGGSLFLHYERLLSMLEPYELRKLRMVLLKGEEELAREKGGVFPVKRFESRENKQARIVAMYEGWSATEAAVAEECSEGFIRKLRNEAGVNQMDGGNDG